MTSWKCTIMSSALIALMVVAGGARATTYYEGEDLGAGPPPVPPALPNSAAAAAAFDAAAVAGGDTLHLINFEGLPPGEFVTLGIGPGVTATVSGVIDPTVYWQNPTYDNGIAVEQGDWSVGFNTTPGGNQYLRVSPDKNAAECLLTFDFDDLISAWGAYLTGVGTWHGEMSLRYDDGTLQVYPIPGPDRNPGEGRGPGGGQFLGFVLDSGKRVDQVTLRMGPAADGENGPEDMYSLDDMRYADLGEPPYDIPEPLTMISVLAGVMAVGSLVRRRRPASA